MSEPKGRSGGGMGRWVGPRRRAGDTQSVQAVMEASEILVDVSGLCVDYGLGDGAVHAVVDAELTLRQGEVLGLAGESGSGKSTLAYAITRLLRPPGVITAGQARFGSSVTPAHAR